MKVALISGLCVEWDAISASVLHQRRELLDAGHEVKVFTHHSDALPVEDVAIGGNPWNLVSDPFYVSCDVAIFHFGIMYELFDALLLAHPTAVRIVHFHNVTPPELLTGPAKFAADEGIKQLSIIDRADVIWADSPYNASVAAELADVRVSLVRDMPFHVPAVDHPADRTEHASPAVLYVGRFVPAKGVHDLIEAFAKTRRTIDAPAVLWLAGSRALGDEGYLEELHELVVEHDLTHAVTFLHDLPDAGLRDLYQRASVFATASRHEGFCVPVVEALASGCQVVTTDSGALPDTVNEFGIVVPTGDVGLLSEALGAALTAGSPAEDRGPELSRYLEQFGSRAFRRRLLDELDRARQRTSLNSSRSPDECDRAARRQRRLLEVLRCPTCRQSLALEAAIVSRNAVVSGQFHCGVHGTVGRIDRFRPDFISKVQPTEDSPTLVPRSLDLHDDVSRHGDWVVTHAGLTTRANSTSRLQFFGGEGGVSIELSGFVEAGQVRLKFGSSQEVDLEVHTWTTVVEIGGPIDQIELTVEQNTEHHSKGSLTVSAVSVRVAPDEVPMPGVLARNRGNPFPERFLELLAEQSSDALVLDCGGGDRRLGDDRVINVEYLGFDLPDLYADGLGLPFTDDTFDLILSQAVLEHVPDPQRAVDEVVRVLKPGGLIYVEIAYIQPLHAVPYHFMNVTPHGIAHLCRELDTIESGVFGGLAMTVGWFSDLVGARAKVGDDAVEQMLATLSAIDQQMTDVELEQVASAVFLLGRKPDI